MTTLRTLAACLVVMALAAAPLAQAQVDGTGPSDPSHFFNGSFNIPTDPVPTSTFAQQINLFDGGLLTAGFMVGVGSELNIYGGNALGPLIAQQGSEVNILGGNVGDLVTAHAQVNISGGTVGDDFRVVEFGEINISGGTVGDDFIADFRSRVNISGGTVGERFDAFAQTTINITGGTVGANFKARNASNINVSGGQILQGFEVLTGSIVNITGGTFGNFFDTQGQVTISGGDFGQGFQARSNSVIEISGGTFGNKFTAFAGTDINIRASEFFVDGQELTGLNLYETIVFNQRDVTLSGTLTDGSAFSFDLNASGTFLSQDIFEPLANLKITFDPFDTIYNIYEDAASPTVLQHREQLNLFDGHLAPPFGSLTGFAGSEINIHGGSVLRLAVQGKANIDGGTIQGDINAVSGGQVNVEGGTIQGQLTARAGSEITITGGTFEDALQAYAGSEINLFFTELTLDGQAVPGLNPNQVFTLTDRDATLAGILLDGSAFSFDLNSARVAGFDYLDPNATLNINLIPEPTSAALLALAGLALLRRRRA